MKVYRIAYLGEDGEVALACEAALKGDDLRFMRGEGDRQGMERAVEFNADIILWDKDNLPPDAAIPIEQMREAGLDRQPVVVVVRDSDVEGAVTSLGAGASDFIYKPIRENPFPRVIAAFNAGARQRRIDWCNRVIENTNNQIRGIFATLSDPVYVVSPDYQILWMNHTAEEIFGEGQLGGACYHIFFDRAEPCDVCARSKGSARWRATLKNGKNYRFISAVTRNSKGETEKLAIGMDITPDEEVGKIHKTFIANVSHDLRTPLAAIDQYANILLEGLGGALTDDQVNYVDVIRRSSFRLRNLVENLIDANKILSGGFKLKLEVVEIQEILDIVLGRLQSQADDKGIMLQAQVSEGLPPVYADRARIAQVIANLAGNSIKFAEQGMLQIRAGFMPRDEGRVIVSVEDTGIGIPKEDLGKIFELFYRVEKDKVYVEEGAGLGLSISREIIRAHGGTLWAESIEGMGSAFHFSIPAHKGQAAVR